MNRDEGASERLCRQFLRKVGVADLVPKPAVDPAFVAVVERAERFWIAPRGKEELRVRSRVVHQCLSVTSAFVVSGGSGGPRPPGKFYTRGLTGRAGTAVGRVAACAKRPC